MELRRQSTKNHAKSTHPILREYNRQKTMPVKRQSLNQSQVMGQGLKTSQVRIKTQQTHVKQDPNFSKYKNIIMLGSGNNSELLKEIFGRKGWKVSKNTSKSDMNFHVKWVQCYTDLPYDYFVEGNQLVNHIPNIQILTSKTGLLELIKNYEQKTIYHKINSSQFFPQTYILNLDKDQMTEDEKEFMEDTVSNEGIWIHKPWNLNCGGGIKMVGNIYKFKREFQMLKKDSQHIQDGKQFYSEYFSHSCIKSVIQRYVDKPLLLNNKKFDIRCYLLIACVDPLIVYYHQGYLRLSMVDFSMVDIENNEKIFTHLTNAAVQKMHKDYEACKEDTIWSMDQFFQFSKEQLKVPDHKINGLEKNIKKFLTHTMHISEEKLSKKLGCFELMGIDIIIDENFKPYLIEMNTNPAIHTDTKVKNDLVPKVVENGLDLVIEIHKDPLKRSQKLKNLENFTQGIQGDYELLINSHTQFSYNNFYEDMHKLQSI